MKQNNKKQKKVWKIKMKIKIYRIINRTMIPSSKQKKSKKIYKLNPNLNLLQEINSNNCPLKMQKRVVQVILQAKINQLKNKFLLFNNKVKKLIFNYNKIQPHNFQLMMIFQLKKNLLIHLQLIKISIQNKMLNLINKLIHNI